MFAYGGHSTFPTIEHDMKKPKDFTKSILLAFSIVTVFYVTTVIVGTITYGNSLRDSIINSLQTPWIQQTVNILISVHCILSTLIMINPLNLEAEEFFRIPQGIGIQRILVRGGMMALIAFFAESVPNFGPVIDLMGAFTFTLTCIVLPNLFYIYLKARENRLLERKRDDGPVTFREMIKYNNKLTTLVCGFFILLGVVCGTISTIIAIHKIISTNFKLPCYLKIFFTETINDTTSSTNCCGAYQNITSISGVNPDSFCNVADFHFYN